MKKAAALLVVMLALVAGCRTPLEWTHPTASEDQRYKDEYQCKKEREALGVPVERMREMFIACMKAKGWREK